jgi:formyltetrahydrofolate deformylase
MKNSAILLISCPDRKGEVATIADFVYRHNGNILHADFMPTSTPMNRPGSF